jgi:threonine synthase
VGPADRGDERRGGGEAGVVTGLVCAGCGQVVAVDDPAPFRCPRAGDGGEHVLARAAAPARWPVAQGPGPGADPIAGNPFVRYRALSYPWQVARARGLADDAYLALVGELDRAITAVDGRGLAITPYRRSDASTWIHDRLWVKDETGQVAGSHKVRHLAGVALWLAVAERTGLVVAGARARPLAIASCGNAAVAAAVVARAIDRRLRVFVPPSAEPKVVARLTALGAELEVCPRVAGDPPGDPCHHRFRAAVADGAVPFSCQGPDCGLTIDGGLTLGFELAEQDAALVAAADGEPLDRVVVQVGGGALATAVARGLAWAQAGGVIARAPALHPLQTEGCFPLVRAWRRVATALAARLGGAAPAAGDDRDGSHPRAAQADAALAAWLRLHPDRAARDAALAAAAADRAAYMWPWEREPRSVATGILDDETYDWLAIVRATLATGGHPIIASESDLRDAHLRGRASGVPVSATGAAGLAGVLALTRAGALDRRARVAVLFTGVER